MRKTLKRINEKRLIELLRRNRSMVHRLSAVPENLIELSDAEFEELTVLKSDNNLILEGLRHGKRD